MGFWSLVIPTAESWRDTPSARMTRPVGPPIPADARRKLAVGCPSRPKRPRPSSLFRRSRSGERSRPGRSHTVVATLGVVRGVS